MLKLFVVLFSPNFSENRLVCRDSESWNVSLKFVFLIRIVVVVRLIQIWHFFYSLMDRHLNAISPDVK